MSPHGQAATLDRARSMDFRGVRNVASGFEIAAGESSWLLRIPTLTEAEGREVARLLSEIEEREARAREEDARRAERDAGPDLDLVREAEDQARADFERHERGRPRRVEETLIEARDLLRVIAATLDRR
jgi:hypothetical protein